MAIIQDRITGATVGVESDNTMKVSLRERLQTFSASFQGVVPDAAPTDSFTITGSANKLIKIWQIKIEGTKTVAGSVGMYLIKRSTLDEAGTSTTATNGSFDSDNSSSTAIVKAYTVNPGALGTGAGTVYSTSYYFQATGAKPEVLDIKFGESLVAQPITLNSNTESLVVNFAGSAVGGGLMNFMVVWTEE